MIALVALFAVVLVVQLPGLLGQGDRRTLVSYLVLMAVALAFCALIAMGIAKPGFSTIFTRLGEAVLGPLGLLELMKPD